LTLFADHEQLVGLIRDTLATRPPDEPIIDALRRAVLQGVEQVAAEPSLFLRRSRLAASVPAADARSRHLDADYENAIAEAVAATRRTDPATDVYARVVARAAWGANRAARDVWVATDAKRDPRSLVNQAFDVLGDCLRSDKASVTRPEANVATAHDGAAASS
jgi:AcrR family transcriptional regulator